MQRRVEEEPPATPQSLGDLRFSIKSHPEDVRRAIDRVMGLVAPAAVKSDDRTAIELTLAEILNNIVEHAYSGRPDGVILISVSMNAPEVQFVIVDRGKPMPSGRLPSGKQADPSLSAHEQAEGGYGLFLIRQMARKLRYRRIGDENEIRFRVSLGRPLHVG